jgi:2-polyprenyl-6-methoxyphenol hydroxylase-like FAD-dependent oxidoreductase
MSTSTVMRRRCDVMIVGGGPAGLVLSILLSRFGVSSLLVERSHEPSTHPQAHFVNLRTMEILRDLGLNEKAKKLTPPLADWKHFRYCSHLHPKVGVDLGSIDHFGGMHDHTVSPEQVLHCPSNKMVPLLLEAAKREAKLGAGSAVHYGHAYDRHTEYKDGIIASVSTAADTAGHAQGEQYEVQCKYLVGADGASSRVRAQVPSVLLDGVHGIQHLMNVHFESTELGALLRQEEGGRRGMLYFVFNERVVLVLVAHNLQTGEFVAQLPYWPPVQQPEDFTPDVCTALIKAAVGSVRSEGGGEIDSEIAFELLSIKPWSMNALVANTFCSTTAEHCNSNNDSESTKCDSATRSSIAGGAQLQGGRVLLVGDAAHQFPPAGGLGMNTSVQDSHNLAWKLAATLHGFTASASSGASGEISGELLRSYSTERRPVALSNAALSLRNFRRTTAVAEALGLSHVRDSYVLN